MLCCTLTEFVVQVVATLLAMIHLWLRRLPLRCPLARIPIPWHNLALVEERQTDPSICLMSKIYEHIPGNNNRISNSLPLLLIHSARSAQTHPETRI